MIQGMKNLFGTEFLLANWYSLLACIEDKILQLGSDVSRIYDQYHEFLIK
jgi:hypothetical protein